MHGFTISPCHLLLFLILHGTINNLFEYGKSRRFAGSVFKDAHRGHGAAARALRGSVLKKLFVISSDSRVLDTQSYL
ncbi:hypothetical protein EJB05_21275, partial [Eragrostis curvula]